MQQTNDIRPGDLVALIMDLPHPTRETLSQGTQGIVTRVYRGGLLSVDLLDRDESTPRTMRSAAVEVLDRGRDITVDWNILANLKRLDPSLDLEALRHSPVFPPRPVYNSDTPGSIGS
jgi:hypothetical protein